MTTTKTKKTETKKTGRRNQNQVIDCVQSCDAKDGSQLVYREWRNRSPKQCVILLGRLGEENSLSELAPRLSSDDAAVFALERRGSGQSAGVPSAEHFGVLVSDVDAFFRHVCDLYRLEETSVVVVGHGLGGLELATWVHDYAPCIRHAVLVDPKLAGTPSGTPSGTSESAARVASDSGAIVVPITVVNSNLISRNEKLTRDEFLSGVRGKVTQVKANSNDTRDVCRAIEKAVAFRTVEPDLTTAHKEGYTYDEFSELSKPLPLGFKSISFAIQRTALATVGRLSRGVQVGWETGFDSGVSLDHVYENEPRGFTFLGKAIDRFYLDAVGWQGIRQRRVHMQRQLTVAISAAKQHGKPVRVLDIAAGAGRYVLETIRNHDCTDIDVELRDFHQHNLDKAQAIANDWGLTKVKLQQHDAFAAESYSELDGTVDVAIVSGLFELFPDNDMISNALAGVRRALRPGGRLIYTNQPWHPQLEMIARVLPSHRGGDSWVMRRRTQAEMDQLVRRAGWEKLDMQIDRWGIFTVSTAVVK